MRSVWTRTAKSAKGKLALTLLGVLAVFGAVAFAVSSGAPTPQDFTISISPKPQSVQPGGLATYTVTVNRTGGFTGEVKLDQGPGSVPHADGAKFVPDKTVPPGSSTATLQIQTHDDIDPGSSYTVNVKGSAKVPGLSGNTTRSDSAQLDIQEPDKDFTISLSPDPLTVQPGDLATYTVTVNRTGGFTGEVKLDQGPGVPHADGAKFLPDKTIPSGSNTATLQIQTHKDIKPGSSYAVSVKGSAKVPGRPGDTKRTYSATLIIGGAGFSITGDLTSTLTLGGAGQPLNLSITNPFSTTLTVSNIQVQLGSIQKATGAIGDCTAADFEIVQTTATVNVPPNSTRTLDDLGAQKPVVKWVDRPVAQNGCLGAQLVFNHSADGTH